MTDLFAISYLLILKYLCTLFNSSYNLYVHVGKHNILLEKICNDYC